MKDFKRYLGDGLYGSFDGCERETGVHEVFLDGKVMRNLMDMAEEIKHRDEPIPEGGKP